MSTEAADKHYVNVAVHYGVRRALAEIIVEMARKWHLPISLGFALCEQETGFRNVFGHDPTKSIPDSWKGSPVTTEKYKRYRSNRSRFGMQGVGVCQLTWWETQDVADRQGGCQRSGPNISVGFQTLAARVRAFGYVKGIERYNGSGPAAVAYSRTVRARADKWHRRLAS
jgi:hypothetical protein